MLTIGVLALQGAFIEHIEAIKSLKLQDVKAIEVRNREDLKLCDALIIPGGESTSISIIAERGKILEELQEFVKLKPTWGTCAGMILLAEKISNPKEGGQLTLEC